MDAHNRRAGNGSVELERQIEEPLPEPIARGMATVPASSRPSAAVLGLQRRGGNRAVGELLRRRAAMRRMLNRQPAPAATDTAPGIGGAGGSDAATTQHPGQTRWQAMIFVPGHPMDAHEFRVETYMQFYGVDRGRAEQIVDSTSESDFTGPHNTDGVKAEEVGRGKWIVVRFELEGSGGGGSSGAPGGSGAQTAAGSGDLGTAGRTKEFLATPSGEQAAITAEANRRFWRWSGLTPGTQLTMDPSEKDARKVWMNIRDEVLQERDELNSLDPRIKATISADGAPIDPGDYQAAMRVVEKLRSFSDEDWALYRRRVTTQTTDWGVLEDSINRFMARQRSEHAVFDRLRGQENLYTQVKDFKDLEHEMFTPLDPESPMTPYAIPANAKRYDDAKAALETALNNADYKDVADFDAACAAYLAVFRSRAVEIAMLALNASEQVVRSELIRYQKPEEVQTELDRLARFRALYQAASKAHARARPTAHIYGHGIVVYDPPTLAQRAAAAEAAEEDTAVEAERGMQATQSPILKDPKLTTDQLGWARTPASLGEWLRDDAQDRLDDIIRSRARLIDDPEVVFKFDRVIALTSQELGASDGSIGAMIVADHRQQIARDEFIIGMLIAALAIGLGLLTFGGGTVAVLAAAGTLAISVYQAGDEIEKYQDAAAAAHSAFDPEGTLSSDEPSAVWAALALVGVIADAGALVGALKAAGPAVRLFEETNDAAKFEAKLAEATTLSQEVKNRLIAAAKAEQEYRAAVGELSDALRASTGRLYSGGLDPDVLAKASKAAFKAAKKGIRKFEVWLADLRLQKLMKGVDLDKLTPEQMAQLRGAFESATEQEEATIGELLGSAPPPVPSAPTVTLSESAARAGIVADARTAGTGGIRTIHYNLTPDNRLEVTIDGVLQAPIAGRARNAPNFNQESLWGILREEHGLADWEAAHLWGPGFGDEAAAGIMLAPREVNQIWQNQKVEGFLRQLQKEAADEGAVVTLKATAVSHVRTLEGGAGDTFMQSVQYEFFLEKPGVRRSYGFVDFSVDPPPGGRVSEPSISMAMSGATRR